MKPSILILFIVFFIESLHSQSVLDYVDSAFSKWEKKDYKSSLIFFDKILSMDTIDTTEVRYIYGNVYYNMSDLKLFLKDYDSAIEGYTKVVNIDHPLNIVSLYKRGITKILSNRPNEGCKDLILAAMRSYRKEFYYRDINFTYIKKEELQTVIRALKECIKENANKSEFYFTLGFYYSAQNRNRKALKMYSRAIKVDNENPFFYYKRGMLYASINSNKKSHKDLKKALALGFNERLERINEILNEK
jgi:tetratricopeptide (TPR) repeat protein